LALTNPYQYKRVTKSSAFLITVKKQIEQIFIFRQENNGYEHTKYPQKKTARHLPGS